MIRPTWAQEQLAEAQSILEGFIPRIGQTTDLDRLLEAIQYIQGVMDMLIGEQATYIADEMEVGR